MTSTLYSSRKDAIIDGGHAEPPITVRFNDEKRSLFSRMWLSKLSHTVGTPAANVTVSDSISS